MTNSGIWLPWIFGLAAMLSTVSGCRVLPEKVQTRSGLCDGPTLIMRDVGHCGTTLPKYLEELYFKIYFPWAELSKKYVLLMLDPDAPMKDYPLFADYVHWVIGDIPGFDLRNGVMSSLKATEIIPYRPPTPAPGSGFHRYQFFLFEMPEDAGADDLLGLDRAMRPRFNLADFVLQNDMCYHLRATFEFSHQELKYAMNRLVQIPQQYVPQNVPESVPQNVPQNVPQYVQQNVQQNVPHYEPQNEPQYEPHKVPHYEPQNVPHYEPQNVQHIPQNMPYK